MLLDGQQIGRYRFVRRLASGGMAEVWLADDTQIRRQVAIKVIRSEETFYPTAQAAQDAVRLFQREAKAIAKLNHPHILELYEYGEAQIEGMTLLYLVMPYRPEGSLASWVHQHFPDKRLPPQEVAHFVGQAAGALQHAHNRQIIHQDVKPSNFLLRQRDEHPTLPDLVLADFGIARIAATTASMSQAVRGSPSYMAPEQWRGDAVPATDQYALAITAYELLVGRPPFQGNLMRIGYDHVHVAPTAPSTLNPLLPKDIDTVLLHALAKEPEQRFASISAFANAFAQAAPPPFVVSAPTPAPAPPPTIPVAPTPFPQATIPVAQPPFPQATIPAAPAETSIPAAPTQKISNPLPETIRVAPQAQPGNALAPTQVEIAEQPPRSQSKHSGPVPQKPPAPKPPGPPSGSLRRRLPKGRRRTIALSALVVLLLIFGGLGYFALVGVTLKDTYTITTVQRAANASRQQVYGRYVSAELENATQAAPATGGPTPAAQARGILDFVSDLPTPVSLSKGLTLDDSPGGPGCMTLIQIVLDADITIPANPDGQYGLRVPAPAHVLQYGSVGNIPAYPDKRCFSHYEGQAGGSSTGFSGWIVQNDVPFTGGRDAIVQQSDIDTATHTLLAANRAPDPRQEMKLLLDSNERWLDKPAPSCQPEVSSDHAVGDKAGEVLVTLSYLCTAYKYDYDGALQLATNLLTERASRGLISLFKLKGEITATMTSAALTDPQQATIRLTVAAQGVWVLRW